MTSLTACLMFKDSASYLAEWLDFHLFVGFDHFFLYDNDSSDDYRAVLDAYIARGQVTLTKWPGVAQMTPILTHCLETNRQEGRWMAFLDDDEFVFATNGERLPDALRPYTGYAGVAVCWLMFGSSGHDRRPAGLVTENFRMRAAKTNEHVKCIVDTTKAVRPAVLGHAFECLPGETIVDEKFRPMSGPFAAEPSVDLFCINHYTSKSFEEMLWRRSRLPACHDETIYTYEQYAASDAQLNEVEDTRIQPLVQRMKSGLRLPHAG